MLIVIRDINQVRGNITFLVAPDCHSRSSPHIRNRRSAPRVETMYKEEMGNTMGEVNVMSCPVMLKYSSSICEIKYNIRKTNYCGVPTDNKDCVLHINITW